MSRKPSRASAVATIGSTMRPTRCFESASTMTLPSLSLLVLLSLLGLLLVLDGLLLARLLIADRGAGAVGGQRRSATARPVTLVGGDAFRFFTFGRETAADSGVVNLD